MKVDTDGFIFVEDNDRWQQGLVATYKNTVLLHDQIKELKELLEEKGILKWADSELTQS